jgi:hypothetical protein
MNEFMFQHEARSRMPLRFAQAGDFHLDEDRYFADTARCLERFPVDSIRASVNRGPSQPTRLIYNMRQGEGIRYETLFRDGTVEALHAVNGKEYVRMLRRAMDLGGFHQVIFLCPAPLVRELSDNVLSIGGGHVVVGDSGAHSIDRQSDDLSLNPSIFT